MVSLSYMSAHTVKGLSLVATPLIKNEDLRAVFAFELTPPTPITTDINGGDVKVGFQKVEGSIAHITYGFSLPVHILTALFVRHTAPAFPSLFITLFLFFRQALTFVIVAREHFGVTSLTL